MYLCLNVSGAAHGSSAMFNPSYLTILLSYFGFGRGCGLFLNLLGSRGSLWVALSSCTSSCGLNCSLIYQSCCLFLASSNSETSIFLAHFFLFCLPFRPLILTKSVISTLIQLYQQSFHNSILKVIGGILKQIQSVQNLEHFDYKLNLYGQQLGLYLNNNQGFAMNDSAAKHLSPQCNLCHQQYDIYYHIPRVVPKCGHTFCQKCIVLRLTVRANRRVYICNQCGAEVIIRKNVGQDVPKNVVILDMIKTLKKFVSFERQEDKKNSTSENCFEHGKIKELVCETCQYKKICSHCALFGQHKNHAFCKEVPATKINFNEVKQSFKIVSDSVENFLLPNGQHNIKENMKCIITEGLKKQVTSSFRHFYEIIERKQFELLQQCENIVINDGVIDKSIDNLIKEYDRLRDKYDSQFKMYTELGYTSQKGAVGMESIDNFLAKCQQLHKNLQFVQKQTKDYTTTIVKQIGNHILQAGFFKIQQLPFSLKRVIQSLNKMEENEVTSPNKQRTRLKSTNSQAKPKSVVISNENQQKNLVSVDQAKKSFNKTATHSFKLEKKNRDSLSQVERRDLESDDFSLLEPGGYSQFGNYREPPQKQWKQTVKNKVGQQRGSLPPKATKVKVLGGFESLNVRTVAKQQSKKPQQKVPKSPAKSINSVDKNSKSVLNPIDPSSLTEDLKFVCPSKSISAQLMSKLQQLITEVDRQSQINSATLQLNSVDLTDTLLLYVIDYIRTKKYQFQVIKLVKNLLTDQGFKILLSYLVSDNCTQVLNLTSNHLTTRSLQLILLFAAKNNILRTIYLSNNKISSVQVKSRKDQLAKYQLQIIV